MRISIASLVVVLVTILATASGAHGQKGGPAQVLLGGQGVVSPDGKTRYVALSTGNQTIVSFVRVKSGHVLRWVQTPGYFGVPVIALDGTTEGVSRDGRKLVLATPSGGTSTQFALVDTKTLRISRVHFQGTWSYDAISPDGSLLYLIQYSGYGSAAPTYRVRAYDVAARRMLARPVVDPKNGERLMRGWSVTRKTTSDGRWAYTLYARAKGRPFVHVLDTTRRQALCVDLPLRLEQSRQMGLRLALHANRMLAVRDAGRTVATVDMRRFVVHKH